MYNSQQQPQQSSVNEKLEAFRKHLAKMVMEENIVEMVLKMSPGQQDELIRSIQAPATLAT